MNEKRKMIKTNRWAMRAEPSDKKNIEKLAKHLGCKESEAVRRAIRFSLATMPKTALLMR